METVPQLPIRSHSLHDMTQVKKINQSPLGYEADFEALFSSSPLAQSTPRIRLEPAFEKDGKKTLINVPVDSRSLFDPDNSSVGQCSNIEAEPHDSAPPARLLSETNKRKNSQTKESRLGFNVHNSKRMKKHPSPSKAELEGLERAMRQFPLLMRSESLDLHDDVSPIRIGVNSKPVVLLPIDPNVKLQARQEVYGINGGLVVPQKKEVMKMAESMPEFPRRMKPQMSSLIPKPSDLLNTKPRFEMRHSRRHSGRHDAVDGTMLDVDELQLDLTAHDLNMNRV